jgi:hypothetical protein
MDTADAAGRADFDGLWCRLADRCRIGVDVVVRAGFDRAKLAERRPYRLPLFLPATELYGRDSSCALYLAVTRTSKFAAGMEPSTSQILHVTYSFGNTAATAL